MRKEKSSKDLRGGEEFCEVVKKFARRRVVRSFERVGNQVSCSWARFLQSQQKDPLFSQLLRHEFSSSGNIAPDDFADRRGRLDGFLGKGREKSWLLEVRTGIGEGAQVQGMEFET